MMKKSIMAIATVTLGLLGVSCSSDDGPPVANLTLETIGLENLTGGSSYQGWLLVDGQPVATNKFTNPTGTVNLTVLASDLENASSFEITIEPVGDNDNVPSDAVVLAGSFSGNSAQLDFSSVVGDLSIASGQFFLDTFSDGDLDPDNEEFGVWFFDGVSNTAGLTLPTLGPGWRYEGWVDFGSVVLSTGTFTDVDMSDNANSFADTQGDLPNFPGEDFLVLSSQIPISGITFPASILNRRVFITVEPFQDNDPSPFFIEPLSANAGTLTGADNPVTMTPDTAEPSGRATR